MIVYNVEQGSQDWINLRLGIPTASCFSKLLTPKTLKPSASADAYACELVAEELTGEPLDAASTGFMERGTGMESQAAAWYEFENDVEVQKVGFITNDDKTIGCSPDDLVGDKGGLEIKCPSAGQHVQNIFNMGIKYKLQVQGCMLITGREWWDILSYNPCIRPVSIRVVRDEECISALADVLTAFISTVREKIEYIRKENL